MEDRGFIHEGFLLPSIECEAEHAWKFLLYLLKETETPAQSNLGNFAYRIADFILGKVHLL